MCVKKADATDGDGRCFPHMKGTQASVDMTACLTELPIEDVKQVSRDLKREGKNLPAPSEDEVVSFAMSQQFTAKYDPRIPEKKRKTWGNRWKQAEKEKPNGGEFHSWVNTMKESVKRIQFKRTLTSIFVGSSIIVTAACGATPPPNNNSAAPTSEVTISAPATPSSAAPTSAAPSTSANPESAIATRTKKKLESQGIEIADTVKVKGGSYPQYKVSKDSHLAKFDASKHSGPNPTGWTKEDMQKSQTAAANYLTNIALDNETLNDYEANKSAFAKSSSSSFTPEYKDAFKDAIMSHNAPFLADNLQSTGFPYDKSKGFRFVSDGETPRIADLSQMKMVSSEQWNNDAYYEYDGVFTMNVVDKAGKKYNMDFKVNFGITVAKQNGKFLMSGANNISARYSEPVLVK